MLRSIYKIAFLINIAASIAACTSPKSKPVSDTVGKTTVTVNGKKDSVAVNTRKNYGNATVSDPCLKCLVGVVQSDAHYKTATANIKPADIKYVINWFTAQKTDTTNSRGATNGLKIDVVNTKANSTKLVAYVYDNVKAKLYLVGDGSGSPQTDLKIDTTTLKRIRNACYWGVASGK